MSINPSVTQKRFGQLSILKLWIVPVAAFWLCAAGFVGGVLVEKNSDPNQLFVAENVMLFGILPTHAAQGALAIGLYSWLFGLAVVEAERKRLVKERNPEEN